MAQNNEIMNAMDYEVIDTRTSGLQISGTEIATELVAVLPNAIASPFQRYHEVEVKKEVALKIMEYRAKALEHRSMDRDKLCDTMVELAKNKALDKEMFQMMMVAYSSQDV